MKGYLLLIIFVFFGLAALVFVFKYDPATEESLPPPEITHQEILDKIETLGKLELTKFYIKDIIEKKDIKEWYKLDPKVVLIISGEVVGCVDLTKLDSTAVLITENEITVTLPQPEICVFKIDHQNSKVYNIENSMFYDDKVLIDNAYKYSEMSIKNAALKKGIMEETKKSATKVLIPILQTLQPGKKIILK
ncbi:MAG: DUF4230 domain-containing protein [Cytophagaceae bacterium]